MVTKLKRKQILAVLLILAVVLFFITAHLALRHQFLPWEKQLFLAIYNQSALFRVPAWLITQFGSAWLLIFVGVYLLVGRKRSQHWGREVVINGVITYCLVEIAKNVVGRSRPDLLLSQVYQRGLFSLHGYGFPSGHTAIATVVSLTLTGYLPKKWRWLPLLWIPLVAWSRIYLGVHAPLDVIGGFAIGSAVYCASQLLTSDWVQKT